MSGTISDNIGRSTGLIKSGASPGAFESALLHVVDEQATNTAGGGTTEDNWTLRVINTVRTNEITGASLGSNQITLPAGTYWVEGSSATGNAVEETHTRLYNTTDSSSVAHSGGSYISTWTFGTDFTPARGRFTIAGEKVFEWQMMTDRTTATVGWGYNFNTPASVTNIYTDIRIWKTG